MKKKLCKLIFKKELREAYEILNNSYKKELSRIKSVLYENNRRYGIVKSIFERYPNAEIVDLHKNKNNEELLIVINNSTVYLFGESYQDMGVVPKLHFDVVNKEIEFSKKERYIYIVDILMVDNEIGNGTIAMNALINYAKK